MFEVKAAMWCRSPRRISSETSVTGSGHVSAASPLACGKNSLPSRNFFHPGPPVAISTITPSGSVNTRLRYAW
jgi:hypothetical protein